ncbi:hypothetical protein HBP63_05630 [Listeria welshimeri]|uniref:hypothetical protein n=1 Tax=Listeria welshimeri TaxID=1643 RepID=UPI00162A41FB|nr:hypothetical protein [Listeria welshimeri]MBC1859366.1 hypothetical protein [Listeria welshimeri]MBC2353902.1 hypothetical protein [Listeria welshimeri]MBC6157271.1 hypothetical protein [Listeria welshimeri]MBF2468901.1 hypothetical protein [Listeria welshimeri]MBF2484129.1 hypothetical protein [Listeria welshimeri]
MSELEKKINEQERWKCNQLIIENEQQMDELNKAKRKIEETIFNLEEDLRKGFRELNNLNNENLKFESSNWLENTDEEQERAFRQYLHESNEVIASAYKKEAKKMNEERELLYKKRSDIPWD